MAFKLHRMIILYVVSLVRPKHMTHTQLYSETGPRLNIKTIFPRYGDSYVKDKTVGETVLSLTWESLYW